ncbi:hypothetical protein C8J56DRAFT_1045860 [Mycena floridula]|nr:hypothetical protein C8J56DRAFT_1045860 [Mycena floridula]
MSTSFRLLSIQSRSLSQRMTPAYFKRSIGIHSPFVAASKSTRNVAKKSTERVQAVEQDATFSSTYVVCQPDLSSTFNQVPLGAYPVAAPYSTSASSDVATNK